MMVMAKIQKLIDDVTGNSEKEQQMKERFSFLQKMAEAKSDEFRDQLKVMLSNKASSGQVEVVGDVAFEYHSGQHVNISTECDQAILDAVDNFFKGSSGLKDGFKTIVKSGLSGIIGNKAIGEVSENMFFVYPENYSIVRADVKAYRYNFSSKGVLADGVENIFVFTMCKSIVNHKTVSPDFLMHCVVDMMRIDSEKDPEIGQVMGFIRELVACWKLLDECQVDGTEVLRNAVERPGKIPSYVENGAASSNGGLMSVESADDDLNDLTPEEILDRAQRFNGEPVKGLHECVPAVRDGLQTASEVFGV